MRPLMTPALEHELVVELSWGDRPLTEITARVGLQCVATLQGWLALGAHGDARYVRLAEAVVAGRRRVASMERELALRAAELVDAGDTLRSASRRLGITYERLRVILDHARAGQSGLEALAWAAERRARAPRTPSRRPVVVVPEPITATRCI
jgi:hypothetical protein